MQRRMVIWMINGYNNDLSINKETIMTLQDLIRKATVVGSQFNSWDIPLTKNGHAVKFDLEIEGSNEEGYHISIVNYQESDI